MVEQVGPVPGAQPASSDDGADPDGQHVVARGALEVPLGGGFDASAELAQGLLDGRSDDTCAFEAELTIPVAVLDPLSGGICLAAMGKGKQQRVPQDVGVAAFVSHIAMGRGKRGALVPAARPASPAPVSALPAGPSRWA